MEFVKVFPLGGVRPLLSWPVITKPRSSGTKAQIKALEGVRKQLRKKKRIKSEGIIANRLVMADPLWVM